MRGLAGAQTPSGRVNVLVQAPFRPVGQPTRVDMRREPDRVGRGCAHSSQNVCTIIWNERSVRIHRTPACGWMGWDMQVPKRHGVRGRRQLR